MERMALRTALRQFRGLLQAEHWGRQTDTELLACFVRDRDEHAFRLLMERHSGLVWKACRQVLRHREDAEDAYQATFLVLVRQAGSIRNGQTVACWLYRVAWSIAKNLDRDRVGRRQREMKVPQRNISLADDEPSWRELQNLLQEELARLPAKYQAPFVLCCLEGKTKAEAARQLGWKEGTVSSRLAQARKRLQHRLSRRGVAFASLLSTADLFLHNEAAPAALARATIKAGACLLSGEEAYRLVPPAVVGLMEGVVKSMFLSRIKTRLLLALAVALFASGGTAGLAWQRHVQDAAHNDLAEPSLAHADFDKADKEVPDQSAPAAKPSSKPWIGIASRETNAGPELTIQFEDGHRRTYSATADSVLLSYLADSCLGSHEVLSIDLDDTNRMLLRFDLPRSGRVRRADLLLARSQSPHPSPSMPITLAFHEVNAAWQENQVTWKRQPPFNERPTLAAQVDPAAREYRIDVTALVRRAVEEGLPNHGWLVRNHGPLAAPRVKVEGPPAGWSCRGSDYEFAIDDSVRLHGKQSCRIVGRSAQPGDFAMMSQTIRADDYRGRRVRLSAQIKTEGLQGMATLWMRIDSDEALLGIDKTVEEAARGTTDWRPAHIVLEVPVESTTIRLAILVEGAGKVWVDDLKLEAVDNSTPLTNQPVRPRLSLERKTLLPRQPLNMGFEESR